jgi:hypothetical protein
MYLAEKWPRDMTVLKTNSITVYEDDTKADVSNGLYNHHVAVMNLNRGQKMWVNCGKYPWLDTMVNSMIDNVPGSILVGGSEDKYGNYYSSNDGTFKSGFYVSPNDKIVMTGDLVNYTNQTKKIYVKYEIDYLPGRQPGFDEAGLYMMSPGQCDGQFGMVKAPEGKKKFILSGSPITITRDGTLLNLSMPS